MSEFLSDPISLDITAVFSEILFLSLYAGDVMLLSMWQLKNIKQINRASVRSSLVTKLLRLFCHPVDCGPPGASVHGILQSRVMQWVAISFSSGSSWPRDRTQVSHIAGSFFTIWATREAQPWHLIRITRDHWEDFSHTPKAESVVLRQPSTCQSYWTQA